MHGVKSTPMTAIHKHYEFEGCSTAKSPRLDKFLVEIDCGLTRSQIKRLIESKDISINNHSTTVNYKLKNGDVIDVCIPQVVDSHVKPVAMDLSVLYEDSHLIVIDKPAGLVVHPAPGHLDDTLVNGLLAHCVDLSGVGGVLRPGIVHRLDKDTSGVLVVSKTDETHHALVTLFQERDLTREYVALVSPCPKQQEGVFETQYGRHPIHRKKFSSLVEDGKTAITHYKIEQSFGKKAAMIRCRLDTGRTHQIRVHCADHKTPVLGDAVYGYRQREPLLQKIDKILGRQALHAQLLAFVHPQTGMDMRFSSPIPHDMQQAIAILGSEEFLR